MERLRGKCVSKLPAPVRVLLVPLRLLLLRRTSVGRVTGGMLCHEGVFRVCMHSAPTPGWSGMSGSSRQILESAIAGLHHRCGCVEADAWSV